MNKKFSKYDKYVNFSTKKRADMTTLFENPKATNALMRDLAKPFKKKKISKVVCLDALGFILGTGVALELKKPLVLIRKKGKLPYPVKKLLRKNAIGDKESSRKLEIKKNSIRKGDKILLVDEWIRTGIQVKTAIKMIETLGGKVIGVSCFSANANEETKILFEKYNLKQVRKVLDL